MEAEKCAFAICLKPDSTPHIARKAMEINRFQYIKTL